MSKTDEKKLIGQRAAIREHIDKFERYPDLYDKKFALKTINNAQTQIRDINPAIQ